MQMEKRENHPMEDREAMTPGEKRNNRFFLREIAAVLVLLAVAAAVVKLFPKREPAETVMPTVQLQSPVEQPPQIETVPQTAQPVQTEPVTLPETQSAEPEPPADLWRDNILVANPLGVMVPKRSQIIEVIFHDNLDQAPETYKRLNLGVGSSESVIGWVEQDGKYCILHIAAEGGMSGEKCAANMFMNCSSLQKVSFNGAFHTENATSLRNMFYGCQKLQSVDAQTLDTANVTNMEHTFRYCTVLEIPDLSGWSFSQVTAYENFLDEDVTVNGAPWISLFE